MKKANKHWKDWRYNLGIKYFGDESILQTKRGQRWAAKRKRVPDDESEIERHAQGLDELYQSRDHIEKADWDRFVAYRTSADFKVSMNFIYFFL